MKASLIFLLATPFASAFLPPASPLPRTPATTRGAPSSARGVRPLQMVMPGMESMGSLVSTLVADVAATGDDFVYGAVDAPGWVLPLGAILVVGTALAVPLALRPGTEAFEEEKERLQDFKVNKGSRRQQQQEPEDEA